MKILTLTFYQCEICGQKYETEIEAKECESVPITQDKGVKVGDKVRITYGARVGELLLVKRISILNKDYGERHFERYWHTIGVEGDILDNRMGSRYLSWDQYEVL